MYIYTHIYIYIYIHLYIFIHTHYIGASGNNKSYCAPAQISQGHQNCRQSWRAKAETANDL